MSTPRVSGSSHMINESALERLNPAFPHWIKIHGHRHHDSSAAKRVSFSSTVLKREFFNILSEEVRSEDSSLSDSKSSESSDIESSHVESSDTESGDDVNQITNPRSNHSYRSRILPLINKAYMNRTSNEAYIRSLSRLLSKYSGTRPTRPRSHITRVKRTRPKKNVSQRFLEDYDEYMNSIITKFMPKHFTMTLNPETTPRQYLCSLDTMREAVSEAGRSKSRRGDHRHVSRDRRRSTSRDAPRSRSQSPDADADGTRKRHATRRYDDDVVDGDREPAIENRGRRKSRHETIKLSRKPSTTSRRSTDSGNGGQITPPRRHSSVEVSRNNNNNTRGEYNDGETSTVKEKRRVRKKKISTIFSTQSTNYQHNNSSSTERNLDTTPATKLRRVMKKIKRKEPGCTLSFILQSIVNQNKLNNKGYSNTEVKEKEEKSNGMGSRRRSVDNRSVRRRFAREINVADLIASFTDAPREMKSGVNVSGISKENSMDRNIDVEDPKTKQKYDADALGDEIPETICTKKQRLKSPSELYVASKVKTKKRHPTRKYVENSHTSDSQKQKDMPDTFAALTFNCINWNDYKKDNGELKGDNGKVQCSKNLHSRGSACNVVREKVRCIPDSGAPRKNFRSQSIDSKKESGDSIGRRSRNVSKQTKNEEESLNQMADSSSRFSRRGHKEDSTVEESVHKTASFKRPKSQGNKLEKNDSKSRAQPPRNPKRRPPKGFLTFEQVVGAASPQPAEQLSWEALVNARDENGVSPVGLLRLQRRRRRRRLLTPRNSFQKPSFHMDTLHRKRTAEMVETLENAARRLMVRRRLGMVNDCTVQTSPPSKRQKRWDLVIPAYYYDHEYYMGNSDSVGFNGKRSYEEACPAKRRRLR